MDAMLCCENGMNTVKQYLRNSVRALKETGVMVIITHSEEEDR